MAATSGIEFRDGNDQLVDVGEVKLEANMNMPGMQLHQGATVQRTKIQGQYSARIKPGMAGDWMAKLSFDGPRGTGQTSEARIRIPPAQRPR